MIHNDKLVKEVSHLSVFGISLWKKKEALSLGTFWYCTRATDNHHIYSLCYISASLWHTHILSTVSRTKRNLWAMWYILRYGKYELFLWGCIDIWLMFLQYLCLIPSNAGTSWAKGVHILVVLDLISYILHRLQTNLF